MGQISRETLISPQKSRTYYIVNEKSQFKSTRNKYRRGGIVYRLDGHGLISRGKANIIFHFYSFKALQSLRTLMCQIYVSPVLMIFSSIVERRVDTSGFRTAKTLGALKSRPSNPFGIGACSAQNWLQTLPIPDFRRHRFQGHRSFACALNGFTLTTIHPLQTTSKTRRLGLPKSSAADKATFRELIARGNKIDGAFSNAVKCEERSRAWLWGLTRVQLRQSPAPWSSVVRGCHSERCADSPIHCYKSMQILVRPFRS